MTRRSLVIYGCGGHGQVVGEAAEAADFHLLGFVDDAGAAASNSLLDKAVVEQSDVNVIVAVGDNADRQRLCAQLLDRGCKLVSVVHPTAYVSPTAQIGSGVFIGPLAAVTAEVRIDDAVIINTNATIEHHCHIKSSAHVGPGATLGAQVTVGATTLIGLGAAVRPRIAIGAACTIGAGAVVVDDVPDSATVVGVPARDAKTWSGTT